MITQSDIITLHAPATIETKYKFNREIFKKMKATVYLINVARGILVNQEDLIEALKRKEIAGAGLDVFETEPQVPNELYKFDNLIMPSHVGTGTKEARIAMAHEATKNLIDFFEGKNLKNKVN